MNSTSTQQEMNGDRVVVGVIVLLAIFLAVSLMIIPLSVSYLFSALAMGVLVSAGLWKALKKMPFLPLTALPVSMVLSHTCFSKEVFEKYAFWIMVQWAFAYLLAFMLVWFWLSKRAENKAKVSTA